MNKIIITIFMCLIVTQVFASDQQKVDLIPDNIKSAKAIIPIFSQKLAFQIPTSWKPAFQDQKTNFFIMEFTPNNEELNAWQNMLSIQGFQNLAGRVTPKKFISDLATRFKSVCGQNVVFESIGEKTVDGYPAYSAVIGCAKVPNQNSSEIGYYLSIQGEKDLYVIHKSMRSSAFDPSKPPLSKTNAERFMTDFMPIELCKKGGKQSECKK